MISLEERSKLEEIISQVELHIGEITQHLDAIEDNLGLLRREIILKTVVNITNNRVIGDATNTSDDMEMD